MGWRQRFDPARRGVDRFRERAKRVADIRALGDQVAHIRRVGFRGEVLVPIVALLILAVTLALSALAPNSDDTMSVTTTPSIIAQIPNTTTTAPTPSGTTTGGYPLGGAPTTSSYPGTTEGIEGTTTGLVPTAEMTSTSTIDGTTTDPLGPAGGYPGPTQPEGVGPPPSGFVPPSTNETLPQPPVTAPQSIPTPYLIPTPRTNTGSYPAPAAQPTTARPQSTQPTTVPPISTPRTSLPTPSSNQGTGSGTGAGTGSGYPSPPLAPTPSTGGEEATPVETDGIDGTQSGSATPTPVPPTSVPPTPVPPTPTARPAEVLGGNVRWTAADSPIVVNKDQVVPAGAFLTIEPGVEVQFAPDTRLSIAGTLRAGGNPAAPVRMVGPNGRWDGLVGTAGSTISLDAVQIRQAGRSGTALSTTNGTLVVRNSTLSDSGGGIVSLGSILDIRSTQISGNAIAGPVINAVLPKQDGMAIVGTIIGGNGTPQGAPQILLAGEEEPGAFTLEGNQIIGESGPGAVITSAVPLRGTIRCNAFTSGTIGLQLTTTRPDASGFNLAIDTNAFTGQSRFGAAGSVAFNLANNWWSDPSGPVDAQRNPQGRGVPIGVTLQFQPWLTERPACAPQQ